MSTDSLHTIDEDVRRLEDAFDQLNRESIGHQEFVSIVEDIDWHVKDASVFKLAINMALSIDALALARGLAQSGVQKYQRDEDLTQIMHNITHHKY